MNVPSLKNAVLHRVLGLRRHQARMFRDCESLDGVRYVFVWTVTPIESIGPVFWVAAERTATGARAFSIRDGAVAAVSADERWLDEEYFFAQAKAWTLAALREDEPAAPTLVTPAPVPVPAELLDDPTSARWSPMPPQRHKKGRFGKPPRPDRPADDRPKAAAKPAEENDLKQSFQTLGLTVDAPLEAAHRAFAVALANWAKQAHRDGKEPSMSDPKLRELERAYQRIRSHQTAKFLASYTANIPKPESVAEAVSALERLQRATRAFLARQRTARRSAVVSQARRIRLSAWLSRVFGHFIVASVLVAVLFALFFAGFLAGMMWT